MRYHALAIDYDGTLSRHGQVDPRHLEALEKLKASGRKLILVTAIRKLIEDRYTDPGQSPAGG